MSCILNKLEAFPRLMKEKNEYFSFDDSDFPDRDLMEFAAKYRSEDFPNPLRVDCPPEEYLLKIVCSNILPTCALTEHLLGCSPCFRQFQTARQAKLSAVVADKKAPITANSPWFKGALRPIWASLFLLGILIAAGIVYWSSARPLAEIAATVNVTLPTDDLWRVSESHEAQSSPKPDQPGQKLKESTERVATRKKETHHSSFPKVSRAWPPNSVTLDFAKAAVTRTEGARERTYTLPDKFLKLDAKLPKNSPAGEYTVSLLDAFGKPKRESVIVKSSGKRISLTFDLRRQSGPAWLCISRGDEIPDCLSVEIRSGSKRYK